MNLSKHLVEHAAIRALTAAQAAAIASAGFSGKPKICFMGDSISNVMVAGQQFDTLPQTLGAGFSGLWCDLGSNIGGATPGSASKAGTLTYDATAKTLTWLAPYNNTANGDPAGAGAAVDARKTGILYVPSGTPNNGIWLNWFGADFAYTTGTSAITIKANGFQWWAYDAGTYAQIALAMTAQRFDRAAMPASVPAAMAGSYGIGGAKAANFLSAYWQWGSIVSDVDVFQLGTNDFTGSPTTVANYLRDMKDIINKRLDAGVSVVVWASIFPQTTDTAAAGQRYKAQALLAMLAWAKTMAGRVLIWDIAGTVTNPTTGQWIANASPGGVHPGPIGAVTAASKVAEQLIGLAGGQTSYTCLPQDTYDATNNPKGNLIAVAGMSQVAGTSGIAGTRTATIQAWSAKAFVAGEPCLTTGGNLYVATVAGTSATEPVFQSGVQLEAGGPTWLFVASGASAGIAAGWKVSTTGTNLAIQCAKVTRTDGISGEWQALCFFNDVAASAESAYMYSNAALSAGIVIGDIYSADCEMQLMAAKNLQYLDFQLETNGVTPSGYLGIPSAIGQGGAVVWPDTLAPLKRFTLAIPPYWAMPTGLTSYRPFVYAKWSIAGGKGWAVVFVGRCSIRHT